MVGAFIADLCWLAKHCEFGVYLDEVFTDLFMCGLNSKVMHIQVTLAGGRALISVISQDRQGFRQ